MKISLTAEGLMVLVFIMILFGLLGLSAYRIYDAIFIEHICAETREIVSIGGCSRTGLCGVRLDNGDISKQEFPVVGEKICMKYISVKK